jgi:aspartyl-tRNA synthetase
LLDFLGDWKRTHYCGELRAEQAGQRVTLMGWVHRRRDLGQLIFIDLRDRTGIVQVVFNPSEDKKDRLEGGVTQSAREAHAKAEQLRSEYVAAVEGTVVRREKPNAELATGEIEIHASSLRILNAAKTPPFPIEDEITANEETRLRYRYIDLRRRKPHANLALRHNIVLEIRKAMDEMGFYEVETPMLTRATPEGARDYLVPSRVHPGHFYALPQSPQIFKQILMISGLDRYFQIARCFRDEDLRHDRQPDFTQLDLEMSFPQQEDVFGVIETVMQRCMRFIGVEVAVPFRRLDYRETVRRYGSDKPDLRFGMELSDVTPQMEPARGTLGFEGPVFALAAPGAGTWSRKQIDELVEKAKSLGVRGCYTAKLDPSGAVQSGLVKTLGEEGVKALAAAVAAKPGAGVAPGDLVVAVAAKEQIPGTENAALIAGQLRLYMADKLGILQSPAVKQKWEFAWLTGFPAFEWSSSEKQWVPAQHPFTGIVEEDLDLLEQPERRGEIRSRGYDLVLNGYELGSGSIRIHRQDVQARVFRALGLSDEEARRRFGFFLDALTYGTPPHGGIALGIDRIAMLLAGETSLREVIAFPKTAKAQDIMAEAPNTVPREQLDELGIEVKKTE